MSITAHDYLDWEDQQQVFEAMAALGGIGDYVFQPPGAEPKLVKGDRVTASFFDVLRVRPMLGAVFTSRNDVAVAASDRVVVVSHAFWQRHLGRDPAAVGRLLALNGESYTIVGVMPAGFAYPPGSPQPADLWTLWVLRPQDRVRAGSGARSLGGHQSIARLKADVSLQQAQAQLSPVAATIAAANPPTNTARNIGIRPLRDHLVGTSTRSWMLMLLAAVGIVLLIACANVANLWLARASVQQRDAAARAALGASRGRLVQRVLIESLVVSAAGTIVGLAMAWSFVRVLATALPDGLARVATVGIDARVLAVAAVAALVTGLVSGIAPALQGSSPTLATVLNESARGGGTGRGRLRARGGARRHAFARRRRRVRSGRATRGRRVDRGRIRRLVNGEHRWPVPVRPRPQEPACVCGRNDHAGGGGIRRHAAARAPRRERRSNRGAAARVRVDPRAGEGALELRDSVAAVRPQESALRRIPIGRARARRDNGSSVR